MAPKSNPWDILPGETERAFAAFRFYRDTPLADRSIPKCTYALLGHRDMARIRQWQKWSSANHWQDRCRAWLTHLDRLTQEATEEAITAMVRRHVQEAQMLQSKALQRLQSISPNELSPNDLLRFIKEGATIERIARGDPKERPLDDLVIELEWGD